MRERYEFRVPEDQAHRLFASNEGKRGVLARTIRMWGDDPRLNTIGEIDHELKSRRIGSFFYGWSVTRSYTSTEMAAAKLFHLIFKSAAYFEPSGENCGTLYDDGAACEICGAGGLQIGPLHLEATSLPRRLDISKTIGGEIVISPRLVQLLVDRQVTGVTLLPIVQKNAPTSHPTSWRQLAIAPPGAEIIQPTQTGATPFDSGADGECRCAKGDTIGLNLVSEITVSAPSRGENDVVGTRQFIGHRAGVLRPEQAVLVSPMVRQLFDENKITGCRFEVAHLA